MSQMFSSPTMTRLLQHRQNHRSLVTNQRQALDRPELGVWVPILTSNRGLMTKQHRAVNTASVSVSTTIILANMLQGTEPLLLLLQRRPWGADQSPLQLGYVELFAYCTAYNWCLIFCFTGYRSKSYLDRRYQARQMNSSIAECLTLYFRSCQDIELDIMQDIQRDRSPAKFLAWTLRSHRGRCQARHRERY